MKRRAFLGGLTASLVAPPDGPAAAPPAGGDRRHLALDARRIASTDNARLVLGPVRKDPANPLFVEDRPWEPRFDNLYANVAYEPRARLYRCWYSPFVIDEATSRTPEAERARTTYAEARKGRRREMGVCYAVSRDGIRWTKPEIDRIELAGSRRNNLVALGPHGAGIRRDDHDPDPARRYKMIFNQISEEGRHAAMAVAFSPDGLAWSDPLPCPGMAARGDTHNNFLWDPAGRRYVAITRLWDGRERIVGRSESPDFRTWTPAAPVLHGSPERQTYAMPIFPFSGVYLGLVMLLDIRSDFVDCELAWSPDTVRWERIAPGTPLIPRSAPGAVDAGCIYGAATPIVGAREIRIYYGGNDRPHGNWRKGSFNLARLRPYGFAGLAPADGSRPARVVTQPLECSGSRLRVTADVRGALRARVLDAPGMDLEACRPLGADATDAPLSWRGGADLAPLRGRPVQVEFELADAVLYAFDFA